MNDAHLPIVGQHSRSWKELKFVCSPIGKPPTILVPGAQPEITGYLVGFLALRSDDIPVQATIAVPLAQFSTPPLALVVFGRCTQHLESFRECACQPGQACVAHQQVAGQPS